MSLFLVLVTALAAVGVSAQGRENMQSVVLRTHSLSQPYVDTEMNSRWWDFGGSTLIRADSYVRLTADRPSQNGWLFSRVPLTATNWEIEVEFDINGKGNLYGDGFGMFLTKQRAATGKVFGFQDNFEGLGIFFDTYKNHRPGVSFPYVMVMNGDGQTSYDKDNDGKANELAGCSARGIRNLGRPAKLRLTYIQDQNLAMELQYKNEDEWSPCFDISNVKIPSVAYLGFSAETGELSDNHDIVSVETRNLYDQQKRKEQTQAYQAKRQKERRKSDGSSWTWFFLKIILFFMVAGGGYVGYTMYRSQKRYGRY